MDCQIYYNMTSGNIMLRTLHRMCRSTFCHYCHCALLLVRDLLTLAQLSMHVIPTTINSVSFRKLFEGGAES